MYLSKLDDKGRAKLPVKLQNFFNSLREKTLFVTSLDRKVAQIYPMEIWRQTEKALEGFRDNPGAAKKIAFNAADLGEETEMDGQGRVTFSVELRRALNLEGANVHLFAYKGRIEVLSDAIYQERRKQAEELSAEETQQLEMAGLL